MARDAAVARRSRHAEPFVGGRVVRGDGVRDAGLLRAFHLSADALTERIRDPATEPEVDHGEE